MAFWAIIWDLRVSITVGLNAVSKFFPVYDIRKYELQDKFYYKFIWIMKILLKLRTIEFLLNFFDFYLFFSVLEILITNDANIIVHLFYSTVHTEQSMDHVPTLPPTSDYQKHVIRVTSSPHCANTITDLWFHSTLSL